MKGYLKIGGGTLTVTVEEDGIRTVSEHVIPEVEIDLSKFKRARKEKISAAQPERKD